MQNDEGRDSKLRNLSIEEYQAEKNRLALLTSRVQIEVKTRAANGVVNGLD